MQSDRDLLLICSRLWLDRECDRCFGILDLRIDDRFRLVAKCVAGLRVLELNDGNDVTGLRLVDLL